MQNRRQFIQTTSTAAAYSLFLTHLWGCKQATEVVKELNLTPDQLYKMSYVRGDVGFFTERGGTIGWLANKEGIVIVDSQFPEQAGKMMAEIKKVTDRRVDYLINTHHHGDHTSGNIYFKDTADVILAHSQSKVNQQMVAVERENMKETLLPNETFTKSVQKRAAGETITLNYFGPAHTDGDAVIHFEKSNVVHIGDLVFNRRFPYIDKRAGANIQNWVKVLDKVLTTYDNDAIFLFGHSDNGHDVIGNKEDIKAFQNYLEKVIELGQKSIAAGKTSQELIDELETIPGAPEWKGRGIDRSINAIYTELRTQG
jgi:cyclase